MERSSISSFQETGAFSSPEGRVVDGREIAVQFAKYGPNAEKIQEGRIVEKLPRGRVRSRSRSPPRRYQDDYYGERDYRRGNRSRSLDRYEHERYYERERDYEYRNRRYSGSTDYERGHGRRQYDDERLSRSISFERSNPQPQYS